MIIKADKTTECLSFSDTSKSLGVNADCIMNQYSFSTGSKALSTSILAFYHMRMERFQMMPWFRKYPRKHIYNFLGCIHKGKEIERDSSVGTANMD